MRNRHPDADVLSQACMDGGPAPRCAAQGTTHSRVEWPRLEIDRSLGAAKQFGFRPKRLKSFNSWNTFALLRLPLALLQLPGLLARFPLALLRVPRASGGTWRRSIGRGNLRVANDAVAGYDPFARHRRGRHGQSVRPEREERGDRSADCVYAGIWQRLRDRGFAGRPPARAEQPTEMPLRSVRGAAVGHCLHRAPRQERANVVLSHPPKRQTHLALSGNRSAVLEDRSQRASGRREFSGSIAGIRSRLPPNP